MSDTNIEQEQDSTTPKEGKIVPNPITKKE